MALVNIHKSFYVSNYLFSVLRNTCGLALVRKKSVLVDFDIIDDFTTQLMQRKIDKWENMKNKKLLPITVHSHPIETPVLGDKLKEICSHELQLVFEKFLDENDHGKICALVEECAYYKKKISDLTLSNILYSLSRDANIEGINKVQNLCSVTNAVYLEANSNFKHYLAKAIWLKGNTSKAIEIFEEVYHENHFLRRRISLVLKSLICNTAMSRSEAVLVNLVKFTERLAEKYRDYYLLACLWQMCFLSEWFSDQSVALDLIEKHERLRKALMPDIPFIVSTSLKYHKTEPVYRLLEVLLKYDMKMQYSIVLIGLFDYKFRQGDLTSCCEILNWSTKYKIMLHSIQHEKFLKLLLKCNTKERKHIQNMTKYDLKF